MHTNSTGGNVKNEDSPSWFVRFGVPFVWDLPIIIYLAVCFFGLPAYYHGPVQGWDALWTSLLFLMFGGVGYVLAFVFCKLHRDGRFS